MLIEQMIESEREERERAIAIETWNLKADGFGRAVGFWAVRYLNFSGSSLFVGCLLGYWGQILAVMSAIHVIKIAGNQTSLLSCCCILHRTAYRFYNGEKKEENVRSLGGRKWHRWQNIYRLRWRKSLALQARWDEGISDRKWSQTMVRKQEENYWYLFFPTTKATDFSQ